MAVVNSKAAIRGDLCGTGRVLQTARLTGKLLLFVSLLILGSCAPTLIAASKSSPDQRMRLTPNGKSLMNDGLQIDLMMPLHDYRASYGSRDRKDFVGR